VCRLKKIQEKKKKAQKLDEVKKRERMEALQITEDKALNLLENARDAELVFD
jgi:hypothetical protein